MWDTLIVNPMINALLLFYNFLGQNFILAIAFLTILIRIITLPLNLKQQRSMMHTQELQPEINAIQKKYRDNPQKMQEEFKRVGYNPADTLSGCIPTLIQFPILIGLYRAITTILGTTPQALFELVPRVYPAINLTNLIPVENKFMWLNLSQPDPIFVLPIVVFVSMFIQQKLLTPAPPKGQTQQDNPTAGMSQSMMYTMPLMFGFFSLQFPAGLSIYFILANVIGIVQGLYLQRIMNRERAERAARGETRPYVVETEKSAAKSRQSANGAGESKTKVTNNSTAPRRKKGSAKR
ncbi:MAG TPA: YidC/Oxa1 family membrane protein insertase [Promineifilum sp.]|nr:YidC/Oxa1 family membrane protein insertase [Promineifilum sp.]HQF70020.1 YidC/Oxa1 family membrane protein insertase [Promineifilum sp.]